MESPVKSSFCYYLPRIYCILILALRCCWCIWYSNNLFCFIGFEMHYRLWSYTFDESLLNRTLVSLLLETYVDIDIFDIFVILTWFHIWLNIIQINWIYSQTKYLPPISANAAAKNNVRETIVIVISATDIFFFPFTLHENNIWKQTSALILHHYIKYIALATGTAIPAISFYVIIIFHQVE